MLRVQLTIEPTFVWHDRVHGNALKWHVWVEDSENEHVYHSETWLLTARMMREEAQRLAFTIPIFEPLPSQYYVRCILFALPHLYDCRKPQGSETICKLPFESIQSVLQCLTP